MSRLLKMGGGIVLAAFILAGFSIAETGSQKPVLIRDTDTAEGKDEPEPSEPKAYNPLEAEKSVDIGNFYFKKRNYVAAIERYLEALEYQPNRVEAYEALGRAYEKTGENEKALEVYRDFLRKNPDSPKTSEFRSKAAKIEKLIR